MIPTREELEEFDVKAMDNAQCCISDVEEFAYCYRKSFATYIIAWHTEQLRKQEPSAEVVEHHRNVLYLVRSKYHIETGTKLYAHPQPTPDFERGKQDGWEACESCHGIVNGKLRFHSAPEGWQLVPKEPTPEIVQAMQDYFTSVDDWTLSDMYRVGVSAAPEYKEE